MITMEPVDNEAQKWRVIIEFEKNGFLPEETIHNSWVKALSYLLVYLDEPMKF